MYLGIMPNFNSKRLSTNKNEQNIAFGMIKCGPDVIKRLREGLGGSIGYTFCLDSNAAIEHLEGPLTYRQVESLGKKYPNIYLMGSDYANILKSKNPLATIKRYAKKAKDFTMPDAEKIIASSEIKQAEADLIAAQAALQKARQAELEKLGAKSK